MKSPVPALKSNAEGKMGWGSEGPDIFTEREARDPGEGTVLLFGFPGVYAHRGLQLKDEISDGDAYSDSDSALKA